MWLVCGWYVVSMLLVCCRYVSVFRWYIVSVWLACGWYVVGLWSVCCWYFFVGMCRYFVGMWLVCGRYVVCLWSVCCWYVVGCGRYVVGTYGWYMVGMWSELHLLFVEELRELAKLDDGDGGGEIDLKQNDRDMQYFSLSPKKRSTLKHTRYVFVSATKTHCSGLWSHLWPSWRRCFLRDACFPAFRGCRNKKKEIHQLQHQGF